MWITQVLELADAQGKPTGKYRMTARSDEGGGGPFGCHECFHDTREAACECEKCDEFVAGVTGFPSRKRRAEMDEEHDRREYERLKARFGDGGA